MSVGRAAWAEVDLAAIRHNMMGIKKLLKPETRFCAVVKADGYGHGALAVAGEAVKLGADYLAVAILDEAVSLREGGFTTPTLILGYTPPVQAHMVIERDLTQTIFNVEQAEALSGAAGALGRTARVHLKVDTGMGRLGVCPAEAAQFARAVARLPHLEIEGVYTHFAKADATDKTHALQQVDGFTAALTSIENAGIRIPIKHCANSAATLDMPEAHLDMVRTGIIMYGLNPSDETSRPFEPKQAMRLKVRLAMIKDVPAGTTISYGCTFVTAAPSRIATLPIGYADGWTRMLSGKAEISLGGRRAPVVGRICMDQCMADITGLDGTREGDEALLFGGPDISTDEVAAKLGTINYEIVCMVGKRVPRVYIG
ncbi:alanine racemase [Deltaproteobacteria bacterium Smac51]|nr:alanine racemase [Deltaproteobacteria bacterium Smac51]